VDDFLVDFIVARSVELLLDVCLWVIHHECNR